MNDTYVTIRGWIGGEPKYFSNSNDDDTASHATFFRVGVTPRYYSRREEKFTDGVTTWYSVRCYGKLAMNAAVSLKTGVPVLVRGRLTTRLWKDKQGEEHSELAITADSVGLELSNGIANYARRIDVAVTPDAGEPGWQGIETTDTDATDLAEQDACDLDMAPGFEDDPIDEEVMAELVDTY